MNAQKLDWGKKSGRDSYDWFSKYHSTKWNLQGLIEAARNTEDRVKNKLIASKNFPENLKNKSLGEILTLPKEVQYNIDRDKSIDLIEQEVINLLLKSGYATQTAIDALVSQADYMKLKTNIQNGDKYSTKSELVKGLQDLSLAKKLGFNSVNVSFQGEERVDRDITLEFISLGPRGGIANSIRIMDEVKSNMGSFYIGGSTEGVDVLMQLLKSKGTTYEKVAGRDGKIRCFFHITNRELENAVNYVIFHKYSAMERPMKDFTSNVVFTSPKGDVRLLSDMLIQLQSDLLNGKNSTIMKLIWERIESGNVRVSLGYGFYNKNRRE